MGLPNRRLFTEVRPTPGAPEAWLSLGAGMADPMAGVEPEVAALLQAMQETWNASDMDAMFDLAAPEVHWVNVVGMHWQGHADVKKAHAVFFDIMFRGVPLALEAVEHVKALPGGTKIIVARWAIGAYLTPAKEARPASQNRMTIVAVPGASGLLITHVANIEIDQRAVAHNPV